MNKTVKERVVFGSRTIDFTLKFSKRKTLGITVNPDISVTVTAPEGKDIEAVKKIVKKRAPWILNQQSEFEKSLPSVSPRQYVSGETWQYLGRQYRLKIYENGAEGVKLKGKYLTVGVKDRANQNRITSLVDQWYRNKASDYFAGKLAHCHSLLKKYEVPYPAMQIRMMQNRWGSCTSEGTVILNPELIKLPSHCVEYVIMHEMCHLKYHDHSPDFYRLLSSVMPDWEKRKKRLDSTAHEVLPSYPTKPEEKKGLDRPELF